MLIILAVKIQLSLSCFAHCFHDLNKTSSLYIGAGRHAYSLAKPDNYFLIWPVLSDLVLIKLFLRLCCITTTKLSRIHNN